MRFLLSYPTRLALALALPGLGGGIAWVLAEEGGSAAGWDVLAFGGLTALPFALAGYLLAAYLGVVAWVRDAFRAARSLYLLRHLRTIVAMSALAAGAALAAAYFRYEVIPAGVRGSTHYYLVRDRWTGEVRIDFQIREPPAARSWRA